MKAGLNGGQWWLNVIESVSRSCVLWLLYQVFLKKLANFVANIAYSCVIIEYYYWDDWSTFNHRLLMRNRGMYLAVWVQVVFWCLFKKTEFLVLVFVFVVLVLFYYLVSLLTALICLLTRSEWLSGHDVIQFFELYFRNCPAMLIFKYLFTHFHDFWSPIGVTILVTPKEEVERKSEWFCGVKFIRSNFKVEWENGVWTIIRFLAIVFFFTCSILTLNFLKFF